MRLFFAIAIGLLLAGCERKVSVKLSVKTRDAGLQPAYRDGPPRPRPSATSTTGRR